MPLENHISEGTKALLQPVRHGFNPSSKGHNILYGRVVNIVLSQNDPLYKQYNTLEAIQFEPAQDRSIVDESGAVQKQYLIAYKFHSSIRTPVINEIVPLYSGPSINIQDINNQYSEAFYYGDPVGIYTSVEHNAAPDQNTIQNLNNFNSSQNKISSYQNSNTGITSNKAGTDTILASDTIKMGDYFTERGIKSLAPLEGDFKLEGRFGHSIRFGGTPASTISSNLGWKGNNIGSPVVIIRNNQARIDPGSNIAALFEDINQDGSSVYITSDQTIELILGSDNFDSYGQNNDNSQISTKVVIASAQIQTISQSAITSDISIPTDPNVLSVTQSSLQGSSGSSSDDLKYVPDNEDDLNFVQIGEDIPVPLTQGVILNNYNKNYQFVLSVNDASTVNTTLNKAPTLNISSVNAISKFAGQVSSVPTISKNGKALLDLLALTEGTIGQGNYNGYDIMVTGKLIPGYNSYDAAPMHPNIALKTEYKDKNGNIIYSGASGRYQFVIATWNVVMGKGTPLSKFNQDYACWKNILNSAKVPSNLIDKIGNDYNSFQQVINMMAPQWASLPVLNDPKGLYNQAGRFSFSTLYSYYQQILAKYQ